MQLGANLSAARTPCHAAADCGFFQRSSPTGGAANGMPLNATTPFAATPCTWPPVTFAVVTCAAAALDRTQAATAANARTSQWFIGDPRVGFRALFARGAAKHNAPAGRRAPASGRDGPASARGAPLARVLGSTWSRRCPIARACHPLATSAHASIARIMPPKTTRIAPRRRMPVRHPLAEGLLTSKSAVAGRRHPSRLCPRLCRRRNGLRHSPRTLLSSPGGARDLAGGACRGFMVVARERARNVDRRHRQYTRLCGPTA